MKLVGVPVSLFGVLVVIAASACGTSSHKAGSPTTLPAATTTVTASTTTTGAPGSARVVRGTVSGEQVSSTLEAAPTIGQLRAPAQVALSFDDGPNGTYTAQVLALLTSHRVPAVFCLIGRDALAYPDLVRREVRAGNRVCDHTQTHPLDLPALSPAQIAAEIDNGERSIRAVDGDIAPTYFRAPGGNWSPTIESDARADHLIPLSWTVDPKDWSQPGTQTIVTRVLDQLRPGGILLLHDSGGDRAQTVAALVALLAELSRAGWTFALPTWVH